MADKMSPKFYVHTQGKRFAIAPATPLHQIPNPQAADVASGEAFGAWLRSVCVWGAYEIAENEVADGRHPRNSERPTIKGPFDAVIGFLSIPDNFDGYATYFIIRESGWFGSTQDYDKLAMEVLREAVKAANAGQRTPLARSNGAEAHPDCFGFTTAAARAAFLKGFRESVMAHLKHTKLDVYQVYDTDRGLNLGDFERVDVYTSEEFSTPDGAVRVDLALAVDVEGVARLYRGITVDARHLSYQASKDLADTLSRISGALHSIELEWQLRGRCDAQLIPVK